MDQQNNKRKPEAEFRAGNVTASIWRNEIQKSGQTVVQYSTRVQKRFRRDDGNYEDTQYYFPEDLARLILCAQKAFEYTTLKERKDVDESVPA